MGEEGKNCLKCHTAGCLKSCSSCHLPDAYYCSRECQVADWKRHKVECKLSKIIDVTQQTELKLCYDHDETDVKDYDAALRFAKKYMADNLKHLEIWLRQAGMWTQDEYFDYDIGIKEPLINFTYETLYDFLDTVPLESVAFRCEECIDAQTTLVTRQGIVFKPLLKSTTLRKFAITNAAIKKISYLPLVSSLKSLSLRSVKFSAWDGPEGWSPEDTAEMISRLSQMTQLETLILGSVPITDSQLESILPSLPHLRCLDVSGVWGDNGSSRNIGQLTDRSCEIIAQCLPELESLELSNHAGITEQGALHVAQNSPYLRKLAMESCKIAAKDAAQVVSCSTSLLLFRFGRYFGVSPSDAPHFLDAIRATGGRTLIIPGSGGVYEPETGLSPSEKAQIQHTKRILEGSQ